MKILKTKHAWFKESDLRLDASYHLSDGPLTKIKLKNSPYELTTLNKETSSIFKGNIFKRTYVTNPEKGHQFMTGSDMMKSDIDSGKFISKKYTSNVDSLILEKEWILVTRSGTLGNTVFTTDDFEGVVGTDDLIRIIPEEKNVKKGFLYAYLASKFGYGLLTQSSYGGVVKHIEPHHIEDLPIPIFSAEKQKEIHDFIMDSSRFRVEANKKLKEVHNCFSFLFKEIKNTKNIKSINSANLRSNLRFNGNFFLSIGEAYEKRVLKYHHLFLQDCVEDIFTGGREKRVYVSSNAGVAYLSNTDIASINPFSACNYVSKRYVKNVSRIKENMLLTGRVGQNTVGQVFYPYKGIQNSIASDNIIRVIPNATFPIEYLFGFLSSHYGYEIIRKRKTGVGQPFVTEDMFYSIPIPILDDEIQKKIINNVRIYSENLQKALKCETKAIFLIENEIESWQS